MKYIFLVVSYVKKIILILSSKFSVILWQSVRTHSINGIAVNHQIKVCQIYFIVRVCRPQNRHSSGKWLAGIYSVIWYLWNYRNGEEHLLVGYGQILPFSIHLYFLGTCDFTISNFCKLKKERVLMTNKIKVLIVENI